MASEKEDAERARDDEEVSVLGMHEPIAREAEEPRDGFDPVPITLIFMFFGLVGWAGWYLGEYSADFRSDVFAPGGETVAVEAEPEPEPELSFEELGAQTYAQNCATCHQADGQGVGRSFPPVAGSEWVTGRPDVLARLVLHGLQGPIMVAGQSYNGQMPGWGDQLDDEEIAAAITHERTSWGNDAPPVSAELVAAVREATAGRTAQWTAEELEASELIEVEAEPEPTPAEPAPGTEPGTEPEPAPGTEAEPEPATEPEPEPDSDTETEPETETAP